MVNLLIVDDEENLRKLLARVIELEGYTVFQAGSVKEGMKLLAKEHINVVISDVKLPDGNGVELAGRIKKEYPAIEIIVLTAYGTIPDGVKAIKNGAFDYLTKGEHQDKIIPLLSKASEKALLQQKVLNLESRLEGKFGFGNILGENKLIKECIALARKVAPTDSTVLLLGETGTGKEVFARRYIMKVSEGQNHLWRSIVVRFRKTFLKVSYLVIRKERLQGQRNQRRVTWMRRAMALCFSMRSVR